MPEIEKILQLQFYLYVPIVFGYFAYIIAMHGRRKDEKKIDAIMGVVAFGSPSWLVFYLANTYSWGVELTLFSSFVSILVCLWAGIFWRDRGRELFYSSLNEDHISNDSGLPNVWSGITQNTEIRPSQITVFTKSGQNLTCDDTDKFKESVIPYFDWDDDKNIALYVTHIDGKEVSDPVTHDEGDSITFVPAEEIVKIRLRLKRL